ncbi:MAG: TIGR04076 family protein [Candidatus Omnitrophica bacterium]|nr:TIGR04076 family protein [Candidatus Omnitrophota bacterium]
MDNMQKTKFPKLKVTVLEKKGYCYHGYEVGSEFILDDFTHPPKHFCAGLTKVAFPCFYALTFGGEFKFMKNTKSITTACPDGGKLLCKIEVLDDNDQVINKPQLEKPSAPNPKKLEVEVEEVSGKCFFNYKQGDKWELTGLKTPDGFCGAAYSAIFPVLFALNFDATFSFEQDPKCKTQTACPDGGFIKFKIKRIDSQKEQE